VDEDLSVLFGNGKAPIISARWAEARKPFAAFREAQSFSDLSSSGHFDLFGGSVTISMNAARFSRRALFGVAAHLVGTDALGEFIAENQASWRPLKEIKEGVGDVLGGVAVRERRKRVKCDALTNPGSVLAYHDIRLHGGAGCFARDRASESMRAMWVRAEPIIIELFGKVSGVGVKRSLSLGKCAERS
jgi:hypothetical protein